MFRDCSLTRFEEGVFLIVLSHHSPQVINFSISCQLQPGHAQTVNHFGVLVTQFFFVFKGDDHGFGLP